MNQKAVIASVCLLFLFVVVSMPVEGQASGITVTDADSSLDFSLSVSTTLNNRLRNLLPRFVVNNADTLWFDTMRPPAADLLSRLEEITARVVLMRADSNQEFSLNHPTSLIDDTSPPQGTAIAVEPLDDTSSIVSWITDEFADSTVRCGAQSGAYTMIFFDPLYVKEHSLILVDLSPGATYFCQVSSTDLSGNTYTSQEFSFEQTQQRFVYMPLTLRSR